MAVRHPSWECPGLAEVRALSWRHWPGVREAFSIHGEPWARCSNSRRFSFLDRAVLERGGFPFRASYEETLHQNWSDERLESDLQVRYYFVLVPYSLCVCFRVVFLCVHPTMCSFLFASLTEEDLLISSCTCAFARDWGAGCTSRVQDATALQRRPDVFVLFPDFWLIWSSLWLWVNGCCMVHGCLALNFKIFLKPKASHGRALKISFGISAFGKRAQMTLFYSRLVG